MTTTKLNIPALRFKDEQGNDYPDWEGRRLSDVLDYEQPTEYLVENSDYDDNHNTPVLTAGKTFLLGYTNEKTGIFIDKLPAIIFDDFTTAFKFVDFPFKVKSSAMKILIPKSNCVNMKFVYEAMKRVRFPLGEHKRYWISEYQRERISYPSKEEQHKIASILSSVDTKIEQLSKKKELLELYKKGVMQKLFNQDVRFKDEQGNYYPDWEKKKLGEIGKVVTGKTPSTTNKSLWGGEIQFITPSDINDDNKYQTSTERYIKQTKDIRVLPLKSIIYTCIASIGKICISVKPCATNQQINALAPSNSYDNEFIYYSLLKLTPRIKATQATTTLPIINKTEFKKINMSIPCLSEQQNIAAFLAAIDKKIELVAAQLKQAQIFKKGLLQQMFV